MIFSMLTPPYAVSDTHTDEFNELRNKVFYALRDAQNDEPVSNRDELPLDYLQGHKDGLEWAAQLAEANHPQTGDWLYDDPTELAKAIRKGPDMPPIEPGNSPVIPDGWVACSARMPEKGQKVFYYFDIVGVHAGYYDGDNTFVKENGGGWLTGDVTHWMDWILPAAPQQE
ncbi:TPA: DUF551 domain-containing protein [Citrobacter koseri]|nr:DUF551 domain-containing protein [Citrobacter koseri]HDQ2605625.1 DUF551 domain-containing protein [Citrobacter koseri]